MKENGAMAAAEPAVVARAERWGGRTAVATAGRTYTYAQLLHSCRLEAARLLGGGVDLREARVVFLVPPGAEHVVAQWAIWRAGGIAVPLSSSQAPAEWEYIVADTRASIIVGGGEAGEALAAIAARHGAAYLDAPRVPLPGTAAASSLAAGLPGLTADRATLIVYTSGTTSRPKGVVTTHANLAAQMSTLVEAWGWTEHDRVLHVLPLNHVHGIVNVLGCALWAGACCEFLAPFDAAACWERFAGGALTLFMAVPTIYSKLLAAFEAADEGRQRRWAEGARGLRLMVSGSAALPVRLLERWRAVTGHVLLERYGMTEIGMALSNPLHGERRPGSVGLPLPDVKVRLVDEDGRQVGEQEPGEIEVSGPGVFREYWGRPEATDAAFRDGWFRTGDVAVVEGGRYRILGRRSVDIIKTGGYKVSALEIEEVLREHPAVAECAVVGLADEEWGERVGAALVLRDGARREAVALDGLREWAAPRLASYKLPTRLVVVLALPRNAMGKVVKADVTKLFGRIE
jgi:malonyl-CoA/methylmalonyl-CoA synthetase